MLEIRVQSLGQEDALEKEMATHSSTLAWKIPWMEEHSRLQSMGWAGKESDMTEPIHFHFTLPILMTPIQHNIECSNHSNQVRKEMKLSESEIKNI